MLYTTAMTHLDIKSFLYWAWKYLSWKDVYGLEKETRAPKRNNTRLKGALCFTGDTKVLTENGFKRIMDIKVGDKVFSHTGKLNKVTDTGSRESEITKVLVDKYEIETTSEHPFLVDNKDWVNAEDLVPGDKLTSPVVDGYSSTLKYRVVTEVVHTDETDIVYNISVENDNSYLVTEDLIAVHNCKHLYSVLELLNQSRIIDIITRDINEWCKQQLGIENNGYVSPDIMLKNLKANQYDYNIEDVLKSLLSPEDFKKYQDGTSLEDLNLKPEEIKNINDAINNMRSSSQYHLKSELEKEFEPVKRGRKIKRDDIKLGVDNQANTEEEENNNATNSNTK